MSVCDLSIAFDDPRAMFYVGQTITGRVLVHVRKDCTCKALTIRLFWQTHGKGNKTEGAAPSETETFLGQGDWKAGQTLEFRFSIIAPVGPVTYHGHYLNVDWFLQARADVPWAIDPKAVKALVLVAAPGQRKHYLGPYAGSHVLFPSAPTVRGGALITSGIVFAILGGVIAVFILWMSRLPHSAQAGPAMYAMPGSIFLLGLIFFWVGVVRRSYDRMLGPATLAIQPDPVSPGQPIVAQVSVKPHRDITILGAKATIIGMEVVSSGHGSTRKTYRHKFHQQTFALPDAEGRVVRGQQRSLTWRFVLPEASPPTFAASDNFVDWRVEVSVEIHRWPDWSGKKSFAVVPAPGKLASVP